MKDLDANGTTEVLMTGGYTPMWCSLLFREGSMVLMWDGRGFDGYYQRTPAVYRIQAIWDGDHLSAHGLYRQAMASYQAAIHDPDLLSWGPGFDNYLRPVCSLRPGMTYLPPNPQVDEDEPARLAAYAYYRLMLLYLLDGDQQAAADAYATLRQDYAQSQPVFAGLAQAFWDEYSASHNLGSGCQAANAFAADYEEEIVGLFGDAFEPSRYLYAPDATCPFH